MMLGKVRDAVADAAETLRRMFADPSVRALDGGRFVVVLRVPALLEGRPNLGLETFSAGLQAMPPVGEPLPVHPMAPPQATLRSEEGWVRWGGEAAAVAMEPLKTGRAAALEVPPLPRRGRVQGGLGSISRPAAFRLSEPMPEPRLRWQDTAFPSGSVRRGFETILALPVPFQGEDIQRLPKGLWMRYSLQMVRATGENVRNLEVLGLFRLPRKGVSELRHDPRRGRILVRLGREAASSPCMPFILARRRSDGALLSCYLEET